MTVIAHPSRPLSPLIVAHGGGRADTEFTQSVGESAVHAGLPIDTTLQVHVDAGLVPIGMLESIVAVSIVTGIGAMADVDKSGAIAPKQTSRRYAAPLNVLPMGLFTVCSQNSDRAPASFKFRPDDFLICAPNLKDARTIGSPVSSELRVLVPGNRPWSGPISIGAGTAAVPQLWIGCSERLHKESSSSTAVPEE